MSLPEGAEGGQDDWILAQFPPDYQGYAVELGAYDGVHLSNTLKLERLGWTVLCIEPNPRWQESLRQNRKLVLTAACDEVSHTGWVDVIEDQNADRFTRTALVHAGDTPNTMDWVLSLARPALDAGFQVPLLTLDQAVSLVGFPRLDAISLDVDGIELRILRGLNLDKWKPKAVVVERCFGEDPEPYLLDHGYSLDGKTGAGSDLYFVRD